MFLKYTLLATIIIIVYSLDNSINFLVEGK